VAYPSPPSGPALPHLSLGVCNWSLQVRSIAELRRLLDQLGVNVVQLACGDPHHASWDEDALPETARSSGIVMTGAMLGFPGEDYTTPQTIKDTGDSAILPGALSGCNGSSGRSSERGHWASAT